MFPEPYCCLCFGGLHSGHHGWDVCAECAQYDQAPDDISCECYRTMTGPVGPFTSRPSGTCAYCERYISVRDEYRGTEYEVCDPCMDGMAKERELLDNIYYWEMQHARMPSGNCIFQCGTGENCLPCNRITILNAEIERLERMRQPNVSTRA